MFKWLKSWFKRNKAFASELDLYKEPQRAIFAYWDGNRTVQADPLVLYKRIQNIGVELSIDLKVALSASKDAPAKHDAVVKQVRGLFHLKELYNEFETVYPDGSKALTDTQVMQLFDDFMDFCDGVKKNSSQLVTQPMETSPPSVSSGDCSTELNPPTLSTSPTGSTVAGSPTVAAM